MTQAYLCLWWCALVAFCSKKLTAQPLQDFLPNLCNKKSDDLYPHPFKCHAFIRCHKGVAWEQQCSPNLHFNPQTKACDYPYIVKCSTAFQEETRKPYTATDNSGSVNDQQYPNDQNTPYRDEEYENTDTAHEYESDQDYPKPPANKDYEYSQEKQDQNRDFNANRGFGRGSYEKHPYSPVRETQKIYKRPIEKNKYGQYEYREEVPVRRENVNSNYKDLERVRYPTRKRPYLKESGFEFQGFRPGVSQLQTNKNVQFSGNARKPIVKQSPGRVRPQNVFDDSFKRPGGDPLMHSPQNKPFFADSKVSENEPFTRNTGQIPYLHSNPNTQQNVYGNGNAYRQSQNNGAYDRNEKPTFQQRPYNTHTQENNFKQFNSQAREEQYPRNPQPRNEEYPRNPTPRNEEKEYYGTGHNERQPERHHTNRESFDQNRPYESRSLIKIGSENRRNPNQYYSNNLYRNQYQDEQDYSNRQSDDRENTQYETEHYGYDDKQPQSESPYNKQTRDEVYGNQPQYTYETENDKRKDRFYPQYNARAVNTDVSDSYPVYQKQDQREYNDDDSSRYEPQGYERGDNGYQQQDRFYDTIPVRYDNQSYFNPHNHGYIPNTERKPRGPHHYPGSIEQSQERHPHQRNGHQKPHTTQLSGDELEIPNQLFRQGGGTYSSDTYRSRKQQKPPDFDAFPSSFLPGNFVGPRYGALAQSDMSKLEDFDKTGQRTYPRKKQIMTDKKSVTTKKNSSTEIKPLIQQHSPVSYREVDPETDQWTGYKEYRKRSKRSVDWLELALYTEDEPDNDHLEVNPSYDSHHGKVFQVYASYGSGKKKRGLAASIGYGETVHGHHNVSTSVLPSTGQIVHAILTDPLAATKKTLTNKITKPLLNSVTEEKGGLSIVGQNSNHTVLKEQKVLNSSLDSVNHKKKVRKDFTEKDLHALIQKKSDKNKENLEDTNENLYEYVGQYYKQKPEDFVERNGKVSHEKEFENDDGTQYKRRQEFYETGVDQVKSRKENFKITYPQYGPLNFDKRDPVKEKPPQSESGEGDKEFQDIYSQERASNDVYWNGIHKYQADGYAPPIGPLFKKNYVQFDVPMVLGIKTPIHPPENNVPLRTGMFESPHIHVTHHFKPTSNVDLTETDYEMAEHPAMKDHGSPHPYDRNTNRFSYNDNVKPYGDFFPQRYSYIPLKRYNRVNKNHHTFLSYQRQLPPPRVYLPRRKPVYRRNNRQNYKNTFRRKTYKEPYGYRKPLNYYPDIDHHFNQITSKSYGYNSRFPDVNHHVHGMGKEPPPSYVLNLIRRIHPGYPGLHTDEYENRNPATHQSQYGPRTQKLRSSTRPRVEDMRGYLGEAMHSAKSIVRRRLRDETEMYHRMSHVVDSKPFQYVASFLGGKPYAKHLSHSGMAIIDVLKQMEKKYDISGTDVIKMIGDFSTDQYLKPMSVPTRPDTRFPITPDIDFCPYPTQYICEEEYRYRTIDGACNNLKSPILGRSMTPYKRYLPAHYGDGIEEMRLSFNGGPLPGARFVSLNQFLDVDRPNPKHSLMLMAWGQFLDHDFTRTAITKVAKDDGEMGETEEVKCGFDGCTTDQPGLDSCWPIPVPEEDPDFRYNRCLKFVRSQEVPHLSCQLAPREQLNQVTSWIDASMIYGSTKEELEDLRDYSHPGRGGMLITPHPQGSQYKPLLPQNDFDLCRDVNATIRCFKAGDERVNEQVSLTIMHTMWVREHNRIEGVLHRINPHWDGERLFQETRKIISGMIQHIAYTEYIPDILGREILEHYDLVMQRTGYFYGYDHHVDPRVANSFATAAFRFGHTLIQERFKRSDKAFNYDDRLVLSQTFRRPKFMYEVNMDGIDGLTRGLCDKQAQSFDPFFTKQISRSLFTERPPFGPGMDLLSLNLMRGRDHGIPGYNEFRKFCGLPPAHDFDDLSREIPSAAVRNVLKKIYRSVHDIDLFAGGVAEKSVKGGVVGPTFGCIIARQFRDLRVGDRFWYENDHEHGFTPAQLQEIRKSRLAKVLCANGDNIDRLQPWVLLNPTSSHPYGDEGDNPFVPCDQIPEPDLRKWRHGPHTA